LRVRRRVRLGGGGRRVPERRQLKPAVAVRGLHEGDVHPDVVEPDDPVQPTSLDRCHLTHPFHTEFDEERDGSFEVVDDDADMVHPLDPAMVIDLPCSSRSPVWPLVSWDGAGATSATPAACRDPRTAPR
jgi:hypothetical protein